MRCLRLLVADFVPSVPYEINGSTAESTDISGKNDGSPDSVPRRRFDHSYVAFEL